MRLIFKKASIITNTLKEYNPSSNKLLSTNIFNRMSPISVRSGEGEDIEENKKIEKFLNVLY